MMPSVSICIPTYNGAFYLEECLDSALAQTFSDFEIMIVDDQSTDQSHEIAQSYAARDPRIRVVRNSHNLGLVGNWNECVRLARGEYIKFLFQDDFLEPNCVEKMLAVCGANTSLVLCKRDIIFEDESEGIRGTFLKDIQRYNMETIFLGRKVISPETLCKAALDNLGINFLGEPTSTLLHRSVFNRYGFFNSYLIGFCDLEYWIRVGTHTGLIYVPEVLAHFRRHRKGVTFLNEESRNFRVYIDKIICLHDFVFHPLYAPLRSYACRCQPSVNLNQLFAGKVKDAWTIARKAAKDRSHPDPRRLQEMIETTRLFPGFRIVKKIPFSIRFGKFTWKIQDFLSNHF